MRLSPLYLCVSAIIAATSAMAASPQTRIQSIKLTKATDGSYSAVLSGLNFGAAPGSVPCIACAPTEVRVVNIASQPAAESVNVTAWSNTSIAITGITAVSGDNLRFAVYNDATSTGAAANKVVGKKLPGSPVITDVSVSGSGQALTLTVTGSGFGPAPSVVGQTTDSPLALITDWNLTAPNTQAFPWNAGFCGANDCNGVYLTYVSWTDTQVVLGGFGSEYGSNGWVVTNGDPVCIALWPSTSTSNGTTGSVAKCGRLKTK